MAGALFEVIGLGKRFGGLQAIEGVDLSIPKGEIRALIGPNGAGKTTFLNLVTGVYAPTAGAVRFDGRSITGLRPCAITAAGIARTFQHPALFEGLTVRDNVIVAAYTHHRRTLLRDLIGTSRSRRIAAETHDSALHWLEFVGLAAKAGERVGVLIPAERKLLEMARAMATQPRLLLLDEPFAGMTLEEADALYSRVLSLRDQGVTVLLIDHNMHVVMKLADRITVLSFGRKIGEGTPAEIRSSEAVVSAYLGQASAATEA
jgi:branched-chain amino acid transport system ATP-binding protein